MLDFEVNKIKECLRAIHTEADYDRTVKIMNALLDVAGEDEDHPLSSPIDLTSDFVSSYEQERLRITDIDPQNVGNGIP